MIPANILLALQLVGPAIGVVQDVMAAIKTAQEDGRDLTDEEMAALTNKKHEADELAEDEAKRIRAKFGI